MASGRGSSASVGCRKEQRASCGIDSELADVSKLSSRASISPDMGEQVDQLARGGKRAFDAFGADDRGGGGHHRVGRISCLARGVGGGKRGIADQIDLGRDGDVEHRAVVLAAAISCTSGKAKLASSGCSARSRTECPCTLVTCVFGSITEAPDLSFMFWRGMTAPTCWPRAVICSL